MPCAPSALENLLAEDSSVTHAAVVHCETTTGILNPIAPLGRISKQYGIIYIVDAMSSFGAIPIDLTGWGIDFLVSSANKCIEGVPGFSFVICRRAELLACERRARSLSLDLLAQLRGFEKNGQFRYTPPTHAILAFDQALRELESENGVEGRFARYRRNHEILMSGMQALGFRSFLDAAVQAPIITAFHNPRDDRFSFESFYQILSDRGFIIYPGKLTQASTFRIGNIGRLFPSDLEQLVQAVRAALLEMGCAVPLGTG
jgi:2-aminoethylphosphonate-pyruvate transaminase